MMSTIEWEDSALGRKKKSKSPMKKIRTMSPETSIIIMIIIGLMLGVIIYTGAGQIGATLNPVFGGLMGIIKYIVPIGVIITGISLMREEHDLVISKLSQFVICMLCICVIMHIHQFSKTDIASNITFEEVINEAYNLGTANKGGGAIGAIIATPMIKMIGIVGASILAVVVGVVTFLYMIGINPIQYLIDLIEGRESQKEERRAIRAEKNEAFEEKKKNLKAIRMQERQLLKERMQQENEQQDEQIDLLQNEIVINRFDDNRKPAQDKKAKFSLKDMANVELDDKRGKGSANTADELQDMFKEVEEEKEEKTKEVLQLDHYTHTIEDENYVMPPIDLLTPGAPTSNKGSNKSLQDTANRLTKTLHSFGVSAKVENVTVGPVITRYELKPAEGVRVSKIAKLSDDIALNLAAETIRIEAPIPGKQAVGIEIPNKEKEVVHFRDVIESDEFEDAKSKLSMGLRKRCCWRYCNCRYC